MNKKGILLLILMIALVVLEGYAQGCSQCKLLAEQSTEVDEASFGTNINKGILFLIAVPYILLFFLFRKKLHTLLFKSKAA